jgi:hypothetical protein
MLGDRAPPLTGPEQQDERQVKAPEVLQRHALDGVLDVIRYAVDR